MAKKKGKPKASKQPVAAKPVSLTETINNEVIAAALSSVNQPVLLKVCRLCKTKDGPFLNIFDPDKVTAKKIDDLMPFVIAENDDLPHKICFRCSAKVEELHEFVQKCMKTQESLHTALGKKGTFITKTKTRTQWEEKLNKSNMSNDDICNALIKKAMEGIKDIPLNPLPLEKEKLTASLKKGKADKKVAENEPDVPLKQVKLSIEKCDPKIPVTRASRSNNSETFLDGLETATMKNPANKSNKKSQGKDDPIESEPTNNSEQKKKTKADISSDDDSDTNVKISEDREDKPENKVQHKAPKSRPFNIMDHISTIKVNGVGVLFQCKLCNRNFLKKEVVEVHGCAKNATPKINFTKNLPPPEPPKALNTVKYIKIDNENKKPLNIGNKNSILRPDLEIKMVVSSDNHNINNDKNAEANKLPEKKPKPKIGPASKVKRDLSDLKSDTLQEHPSPSPAKINASSESNESSSNRLLPTVNFPSTPSLNSRYKLVPGPNNTFTLVEEPAATANQMQGVIVEEKSRHPKGGKKRKSPDQDKNSVHIKSKERKLDPDEAPNKPKLPSTEIIDLDEQINPKLPSEQKPYPVGLFQTVPQHSSIYVPPVAPDPPAFTTPAMKKQSYTVLQTDNPSKLVISSKPQPPVEEVPKKRNKKTVDAVKDTPKQPFNVTLEDAAPPKNAGFFTFINVDPLLQPSYVLPTDNIIQESQITTSTPVVKVAADTKDKNKYSCNMCGETFSREKKLLAHIQSHYSKMDEEDQMRAEKNVNKKRVKKS